MTPMTSALADAILAEVAETGDIYRVVCVRHGVTKNSFFMWLLRHGSEEQKAKQKANAESRIAILEDDMIESCSDLDLDELDKDTETARVNRVRAFEFALNRVSPKAVKTELSGPNGQPIQHELSGLTDSERAARASALLDAARERRIRSAPDDAAGDVQ